MSFQFYAVPAHRADEGPGALDERMQPELPPVDEAVERALAGVEYRDVRARDRLRSLLADDEVVEGRSAVFARPPQDLPALLRLADQLDSLAEIECGERAVVWRCGACATRYAVPVALVRAVSIVCERCGAPVALVAGQSEGEESLIDPFRGAVNSSRRALAAFFREAMARGWPVLVSGGAER